MLVLMDLNTSPVRFFADPASGYNWTRKPQNTAKFETQDDALMAHQGCHKPSRMVVVVDEAVINVQPAGSTQSVAGIMADSVRVRNALKDWLSALSGTVWDNDNTKQFVAQAEYDLLAIRERAGNVMKLLSAMPQQTPDNSMLSFDRSCPLANTVVETEAAAIAARALEAVESDPLEDFDDDDADDVPAEDAADSN